MIGLVVVSHSEPLARAAVDLAAQMVHGNGPVIAVAAGATGGLGPDAGEVQRALEEADSPDGVLVLMDLGSAVLSADLALEMAEVSCPVRLSTAPFVEGLVAAVARAAGGADLDTVAREAEAALAPKRTALGDGSDLSADPPPGPSADTSAGEVASCRLTLVNPQGLHARPAALLAAAVGALAAEVRVESAGRSADAASSLELMALGAGEGAEITVTATGAGADEALGLVRRLVEDGFGELETGQGRIS